MREFKLFKEQQAILDKVKIALKDEEPSGKTDRLILIEGPRGGGKSTLLRKIKEDLSGCFEAGVLLFEAWNSPFTFFQDLGDLLNSPVKESPTEIQNLELLSRFWKDRHLLLLINHPENWLKLKSLIPSGTRFTVIVTISDKKLALKTEQKYRSRFGVFLSFTLHPLSSGEMKDFLENRVKEDDCRKLGEALSFLPLALPPLAALLNDYSPKELLEKVKAPPGILWLLELIPGEKGEALKNIACCAPGGGDFFILEQMGTEYKDLENLVSAGWCIKNKESYQLHPLVRDLVRKNIKKERKLIFFTIIQHLYMNPLTEVELKEQLFPQLSEALSLGVELQDARLVNWVTGLYDFCFKKEHKNFYIQLVKEIEKLFPKDHHHLIMAFNNQGIMLTELRKTGQALEAFKKQQTLCESYGEKGQLAMGLWNQGNIWKKKGDYKRALELYEQSKIIKTDLGVLTSGEENWLVHFKNKAVFSKFH